MDMKEFTEKYCKNCKDNCDKGLVQNKYFIRCIDKGITEKNRKK